MPFKPTRAQLLAATAKTIPDVIAPDLRVLFCGINPGLYSGAVGHHFARPGNRFWPALHGSGRRRLVAKVKRYEPHYLAVVGVTAFRIAFEVPRATLGLQAERCGDTLVWVLPNPSGLNAHHQLDDLIEAFAELRKAAFTSDSR